MIWFLVWFYLAGLLPAVIALGMTFNEGVEWERFIIVLGALLWPAALTILLLFLAWDIVAEALELGWYHFKEMVDGFGSKAESGDQPRVDQR